MTGLLTHRLSFFVTNDPKVPLFVYNHINVMHQNIAGLISKADELTVCLEEMKIKNRKTIDVLCITEHNMTDANEEQLFLPNYRIAASLCRNKKRGGSCILTRMDHDFRTLSDIAKYSIPNVIECCAIELSKHRINILCVYRVPGSDMNLFFDTLDLILRKICDDSKSQLIICGDFNIDVLKTNCKSTEFEHLLLSHNLTLQFREPTRYASKTCIDNFAHSIRGCTGEIAELGLSDHTAQILKCPVKKTCTLKSWQITRRDFSTENLHKFKECLTSYKFSDVFDSVDPNKAYNLFFETFKLFYDLFFPIKNVRIRTRRKQRWISKGIKKCSKRNRELLWQYRLKPCSETKLLLNSYKKRYRKVLKQTQFSQNNNYIQLANNKCKATWQIINKTKDNHPKESITKINNLNRDITEPIAIANAFNDFFIDQVRDIPKTKNRIDSSANIPHSIFMRPISPDEVNKIVKGLKNKKSVGFDEISTEVLKFVSNEIASPLSHVFNQCITKGIFPDKLKPTIVRPLHKKGDKVKLSNYRPVALIPILSKVFEKYIYNAITNFINKHKILTDQQKGFRKNMTINMAIYDLIKCAVLNMDIRKPICAIYMDMSKAFDCVDHCILMDKLYTYGLRGNVHDLIKSYLSDRYQYTEITQICQHRAREISFRSEPRKTCFGVPQGSVLGPLLFLLYINDMPNNVHHPMVLFADDSTVLIKRNNDVDYEKDINSTLSNIIDWLTNNNLLINIDKTKVMHFSQKVEYLNPNVNYKGETIEEVNQTKFLGLVIDKNLTWKPQSEEICKKLYKFSYALYKLAKVVNRDAVLCAYHGYVASTLRYGIIFWGNCSNREIIFKSQKRCLRAMCKLKSTDTCKPYFKELKLLTFPSMYIFEVALFVKTNPILFTKTNRLRNPHRLQNVTSKTALLSKSVIGLAPKIYNKIPNNIKSLNVNTFKLKLKSILIEKCYYSIVEYLNDKEFCK